MTIVTMKHRELHGYWLPDNRLGSVISNLLCALRLHTPSCRGTVRCSRRRFGIAEARPTSPAAASMSSWQPCGHRLRECIDDVCRSMGECAWPPETPAGLDTGGKGEGAADSVSSEVTAAPSSAATREAC